ncbi:TonB-dependent receptor [uncultured Candidatus Thioglobus sp.]|nr:TonB-dependent receptor [uncultured Candidatus Thioglobus sp.]
MNIKQLSLAAAVSALTFTTATNAVLGPIPIYLNTEYRTDSPVIGSIASTLSFNAEDIKATGANTFLDFLATIPSVGLIDAQGNIPAIFMRGNESDHTLVLIDGVSVNDVSSVGGAVGHGLKVIPLNDIEKIDIIKGYGSVLYGASAIAGVITITTKKGSSGENIVVSTRLGTQNSKAYSLSANNGNKDDFIRFTHNKYTTNGINSRSDFLDSEKDGISNTSSQIKLGKGNFNISYLKNKNQTEYDNCFHPVTFAKIDNCSSDRKLSKTMINTNHDINSVWNAKLSLTRSKTDVTTYDNNVASSFTSDDYVSTDITLLNDITIDHALINIGLSKISDKNITDNQKLSSKNIFINWQKNINNIDLSAGFRHIKHDEFGNHTIYNIGTGKQLSEDIKLTANYNTAFNAPSLYQSNDSDNPAKLKPETSKNINIGLTKQHTWGRSNIELYKNTVTDLITYEDNGGFPNPDNYTNNDKLTTKGLDMSATTSIDNYSVTISHNYNSSKLNDSSRQNARRPKNITSVNIDKKYGKFNSRLQITKKSDSWDLNTTNDKLDGYTLLNLSTIYRINNKAKAALNVKNATNRSYTIAKEYNQLGRTIELGLTYKF